jgi:hypothetical protein
MEMKNDGKKKFLINRRDLIGLASATAVGGLVGSLAAGHKVQPALVVQNRRRFRDKAVIITGATSGIGRDAALQFSAEGGKVGYCGRREALGHDVENEIKSQGR